MSSIKVGGTWQDIASIGAKVGGTWQDVQTGYCKVSGTWEEFYGSSSVIPAGLIVFLNSNSVPSGWQRFTSPDGRLIVGAGDSYNVGQIGGGPLSTTVYSGYGGSHTHPATSTTLGFSGSLASLIYDRDSAGNHRHSITLTYDLPKDDMLLIKSTYDTNELPSNSVLFGSNSFNDLDNITGKYFLRANSTVQTISEIKTATVGLAGNHNHPTTIFTNKYGDGSFPNEQTKDEGNHSGSVSPSFTQNIKRLLLSLWSKANNFPLQSNMIAMWEGTEAPNGWGLCDGLEGRPDLRDCFIQPSDSGNENITQVGNNTLYYNTGSMSHSFPHDHKQTVYSLYGTLYSGYIGNENWSHTHSAASGDINWLPSWYALSFIVKL